MAAFLSFFKSSRKKKPDAASPPPVPPAALRRTRKIEMFANRWQEVQAYFEGQDAQHHSTMEVQVMAEKINELAKLLAVEEKEVIGNTDEAPPCFEFLLNYDVVNTMCCLATKASNMPKQVRCALVLCIADIVLFSGGVKDRPLIGHFVQVTRPVASLITYLNITDEDYHHDALLRYVSLYLVYAVAYQLTAFPSCAEFFYEDDSHTAFALLDCCLRFLKHHPPAGEGHEAGGSRGPGAPGGQPQANDATPLHTLCVMSEAVHTGRGVVIGEQLYHADLALDVLRCLCGVWYSKVARSLAAVAADTAAHLAMQLAWLCKTHAATGSDRHQRKVVEGRVEKLLVAMDWIVEHGNSEHFAAAVVDTYTTALHALFKGEGVLVLRALRVCSPTGKMLTATYRAGVGAATALASHLVRQGADAGGWMDARKLDFVFALLRTLAAACPTACLPTHQRAQAAQHLLPHDFNELFHPAVMWDDHVYRTKSALSQHDVALLLAANALPSSNRHLAATDGGHGGVPEDAPAILTEDVLRLAGAVIAGAGGTTSMPALLGALHFLTQVLVCEATLMAEGMGVVAHVLFNTRSPVAEGLAAVRGAIDARVAAIGRDALEDNLHAARVNLGIEAAGRGGVAGGGECFDAWCALEEWRIELHAALHCLAGTAALQYVGRPPEAMGCPSPLYRTPSAVAATPVPAR